MNILYGICGFGNGHVARSSAVLKALLARGHHLAVFGFDSSEDYILTNHPDIPLFRIKVPVLHPSRQTGLDFGAIAVDSANHYADGISTNYRAMQSALDYFGGTPDLVISDYELVAAEFAYATLTPLVSIDQHSKFAGFNFPPIGEYTRLEDYSRLNLFFPQAAARYACTFFEVGYPPNPQFPVTLIPPILRNEVINLATSTMPNEILFYISSFARIRTPRDEIHAILRQFPEKTFHIFPYETNKTTANLHFHEFSRDLFLEILGRAEAVIATAGHTLLSELAYLQKPALTIPADSFDQQTCAQVIQQNGLGLSTELFTVDTLAKFFANLPAYRENLQNGQGLVQRWDGVAVLLENLEKAFGI